MSSWVVSHVTIRPLLDARRRGAPTVDLSLDLGRTTTAVALAPDGVRIGPDLLTWHAVESIAAANSACFTIEPTADDGPLSAETIKAFSAALGRAYTLYPTERAPTMLVSGIPMHRIKGTDPLADTDRKVAALRPVGGRVLDTATGLGYTAIALAKAGAQVTTIELDPVVLDLARRNPWSQELFQDARIEQRVADAAELTAELPSNGFSAILHDPPTLSLAGDLYGLAFYRGLFRLLRPGGRLFHYVGNPASPSGGRTTKGVARRLGEAGFERVRAVPDAFGIVAVRPVAGRR
ncbi:MAG TPA: methyltransferase domain-containing protein [Candidatus Limnocylindrales bacterium]|nr:methyltransferase domain-containing protein [Candidatus Limnocylindrales bacterium]